MRRTTSNTETQQSVHETTVNPSYMASTLKESSTETAGSDALKCFLTKHQHALKTTNASKLDDLYNKLTDGGVDHDDLLQFDVETMIASLSECGLKAIEVGRIVAVLLKEPGAYVHQQTATTKIVAVSDQEVEALEKTQKAADQVQGNLDAVLTIISGVEAKSKDYTDSINQTCDAMISNVNQQRSDLLSGLTAFTQQNRQNLLAQQAQLEHLRRRIEDFNAKSQQMMHDPNMDRAQRKETIMTNSKTLVSAADGFVASEYVIELKADNRVVNQDTVSESFTNFQMIHQGVPCVPTLNMKDIKTKRAVVCIVKADGSYLLKATQYKVEIASYTDADSQIEWTSLRTRSYQDNLEVPLEELTSFTKYKVRVSLKNQHGWGPGAIAVFESAKHFKVLLSNLPVLVESYLHNHIYEEHPNQYHFDEMISNIIQQYVMNSCIFDVVADKWKDNIGEEGALFQKPQGYTTADGVYVAACSNALVEWHVRALQGNGSTDYAIGIISELTEISEGTVDNWIRTASGSFVCYHFLKNGTLSKNKRAPDTTVFGSLSKLNANDVLTIRLDYNRSAVTFIKNGEEPGATRKIPSGKTFYFFIAVHAKNRQETSFRFVSGW